jgi:hypothetical protein
LREMMPSWDGGQWGIVGKPTTCSFSTEYSWKHGF